MARQLELFDDKGDRIFEGMHEVEASPFVTEKFNVASCQETCWCTKKEVKLEEDGIKYTVSSICGSEEKKQFYSSVGTISSKRVCCAYKLSISGLASFEGDLCMCQNPCCVTGKDLQKLKSKIEERVEYMQAKPGGGQAGPVSVVIQQAAPPPAVVMQPAPVVVAAQPQMVAAPQMVAVQQ